MFVREEVEWGQAVVIVCGVLMREVAMWTAESRRRYERSGLRYPSDLTDAEWALVELLIAPAKQLLSLRVV